MTADPSRTDDREEPGPITLDELDAAHPLLSEMESTVPDNLGS